MLLTISGCFTHQSVFHLSTCAPRYSSSCVFSSASDGSSQLSSKRLSKRLSIWKRARDLDTRLCTGSFSHCAPTENPAAELPAVAAAEAEVEANSRLVMLVWRCCSTRTSLVVVALVAWVFFPGGLVLVSAMEFDMLLEDVFLQMHFDMEDDAADLFKLNIQI